MSLSVIPMTAEDSRLHLRLNTRSYHQHNSSFSFHFEATEERTPVCQIGRVMISLALLGYAVKCIIH